MIFIVSEGVSVLATLCDLRWVSASYVMVFLALLFWELLPILLMSFDFVLIGFLYYSASYSPMANFLGREGLLLFPRWASDDFVVLVSYWWSESMRFGRITIVLICSMMACFPIFDLCGLKWSSVLQSLLGVSCLRFADHAAYRVGCAAGILGPSTSFQRAPVVFLSVTSPFSTPSFLRPTHSLFEILDLIWLVIWFSLGFYRELCSAALALVVLFHPYQVFIACGVV